MTREEFDRKYSYLPPEIRYIFPVKNYKNDQRYLDLLSTHTINHVEVPERPDIPFLPFLTVPIGLGILAMILEKIGELLS